MDSQREAVYMEAERMATVAECPEACPAEPRADGQMVEEAPADQEATVQVLEAAAGATEAPVVLRYPSRQGSLRATTL